VSGPTTVRVLRAAERVATAWKNGGGITREVAAFPEGADLADFHWRVSLADVADGGPFSVFPGIDRIITLVRGPGMALTVDGAETTVGEPYRPFAFPGDADTGCRLLGGPLTDLNVMTRRGRSAARIDIVGRAGTTTELTGPVTLVLLLEGSAALQRAGVDLGPLDAVLLTTEASAASAVVDVLEVQGVAAVIDFRNP
jgi:environmental stress-induced protein Ves